MEIRDQLFKGVEALKEIELPQTEKTEGGSFHEMLAGVVEQASNSQKKAENMNRKFASVEMGKIHENVIALEQANIHLKMLVTMRNKLLDSYKELMHLNG